nr:hypothetical protein [Chitinophagaceae bacterium]
YIEENPEKTLRRLSDNPYFRFTDSLIALSARQRPEELVTYAQAKGSPLAQRIAAHTDPLVRMIYSLANDNAGQLYFPFIDQLISGELTRESIQRAVKDSAAYYSLLVKTQVTNAGRMARGASQTCCM